MVDMIWFGIFAAKENAIHQMDNLSTSEDHAYIPPVFIRRAIQRKHSFPQHMFTN